MRLHDRHPRVPLPSSQDAGRPRGVLAGRQRDPGVTVVQPHGLTLEEVGYPDDAELARQAERSRVVRTLG